MSRPALWHPFTQHGLEPEMTPIARAEGAWLEMPDRKPILDAISSWWVVTHGHCHPRIVAAIRAQAGQLDQVIFAGFTHEPAEKLACGLLQVAQSSLGPGLEHVFLSDSGSTSVEVALKMALGSWRNRGKTKRTRILALEHAYHGDTIGTMSAGARGIFNAAYEPFLFDVERIPFPSKDRAQAACDALEAACKRGDVAAFIVEPLVLGAGGMLMYEPSTLREMAAICRRHGVLVIADEVMTGFGRTGTLFACEQAGVVPDILCLAKGLTGGSLPLAATLCSAEIFDAHVSEDRSKTFFHSSSYTANPICCAAANANLAIWREEPVVQGIQALGQAQRERIERFESDKAFANVRQRGTIAALDLEGHGEGYAANVSLKLRNYFLGKGVLLRPLGNTIYVMPPYCTTPADLDLVYEAIAAAAYEVTP